MLKTTKPSAEKKKAASVKKEKSVGAEFLKIKKVASEKAKVALLKAKKTKAAKPVGEQVKLLKPSLEPAKPTLSLGEKKKKPAHEAMPFVSKPAVLKPSLEPEVKPLPKQEQGKAHVRAAEPKAKEPASKVAVAPGKIKEPKVVPEAILEKPLAEIKELEALFPLTVKDLSIKLNRKPSEIIKTLMDSGILVNINQFLDEELANKVSAKFGIALKKALSAEELVIKEHTEKKDSSLLLPRAPVVTFMGHVDHGKTSLLDAIRKSKVAEKEHGGITQHIGAYEVNLPKGKITFLDTPGHEAFTAMRARGANITDIVVLVVAADDGLMPQTKEAIDHARAANVPIIVAINKIDKPQADLDKVKRQLSESDLTPEDWGGKTIAVGVSAKTGKGIDELLEMILLEAEMLELKAEFDKQASGVVIDAKLSPGRGSVASILVQNGTLNVSDVIICGQFYGKIKAMFDDLGGRIEHAPPAKPVEINGLSGVPVAGERFYVVADEKQARDIASQKQDEARFNKIQPKIKRINLEDISSQIKEGKIKELNIILKTDVQGSLGALQDSLGKLSTNEVQVKFIHTGIGNVNVSDVVLAAASSAVIIGFHIDADDAAKEKARQEEIDIRTYTVIYEAINEVRTALEGLLEPKLKKIFIGNLVVRQVFNLTKSGLIAGCFVQKGKIMRSSTVSITRNGEPVFEGKLSSLKRFKDDVREVEAGLECGVAAVGFTDYQVGDVIEVFEIEKIARKL
ncbi:MAG: translation initiation factor IF-2 [Candidatus Omnitrophota bacterium]|nr:translation initiation factor IF-2 [Candidatus Omnitrophota bacterium]